MEREREREREREERQIVVGRKEREKLGAETLDRPLKIGENKCRKIVWEIIRIGVY